METKRRTVTLDEFIAEAEALFGIDRMNWKFVCPGCGHVASGQDYKNAGAPEGAIGFTCIGRYLPSCRDWLGGAGPGPCNYTQGGLFGIAPVEIIAPDGKKHYYFELAKPEAQVNTASTGLAAKGNFMKLSVAQKRALLYLVHRKPGVWVSGTPVTQKCLNVLSEKGLVDVCFAGRAGWLEMITAAGREAVEHSVQRIVLSPGQSDEGIPGVVDDISSCGANPHNR